MKVKSLLTILLLASLLASTSCRSSRGTRMQRNAEKMEAQASKDNEKIVEEFHQHHFDIQADETQKMMKKSKKRNKKLKRKSRGSFVDRMFNRKRSKNCYGN
ncbi:MAG TPA: hypothetical protein VK994_06295 [Bacteroidales bacterium]|nr:hypothetical protein [Bacteroidales bacterium]